MFEEKEIKFNGFRLASFPDTFRHNTQRTFPGLRPCRKREGGETHEIMAALINLTISSYY